MTSSLLSARTGAPTQATAVHARASADFAAKLEQTRAVLRQAAALGAPGAVTQASSLGEHVVLDAVRAGIGLKARQVQDQKQ